jgi:hypothetical protein
LKKASITLFVFSTLEGHATGSLYLDDGETFRYQQVIQAGFARC